MLLSLLLAAASAGADSAPRPAAGDRGGAVVRQATASVRIVSGERISASDIPQSALVKDTQVRGSDGIERPARLVEFP